MEKLKIVSINVNGLNIAAKRRAIFNILRGSGATFCLLQETHGTKDTNQLWQREWGGQAFFSNGSQSSRGVAILVSRNFPIADHKISTDENGRIIIMDVDIDETTYTIGSFYAPTQDKPGEQITALENLEQLLEKFSTNNSIIAGDFNCFLDPSLDRNNQNSASAHSDTVRDRIRLLLEDWGLCDMWRIRYPKKKGFTFHRGKYASRIDYFMISQHLSGLVDPIKAETLAHSDHNLLSLSLKTSQIVRGPGMWRLDTALLERDEFITLINQFLTDWKPPDEILPWSGNGR